MDAPATIPLPRYVRWLPYWAVLQTDLRQTLRSWVWRASVLIGDLLRWTALGSVTLVVMLTVGSITAERGTLADSVLSRGISRYQYFLGKWHARLAVVLGTYLVLSGAALVSSLFLLHEDLRAD